MKFLERSSLATFQLLCSAILGQSVSEWLQMRSVSKRQFLRVVASSPDFNAANSSKVDEKVDRTSLLLEAKRIEGTYGPNMYSSFLRKNGCRPDKDQAAAIGKLLGGRVRASDGSMQPKVSEAAREYLEKRDRRRADWAERFNFISNVKGAIELLEEAKKSAPSSVAGMADEFLVVGMRDRLDSAIELLIRFATELRSDEKNESTQNAR